MQAKADQDRLEAETRIREAMREELERVARNKEGELKRKM